MKRIFEKSLLTVLAVTIAVACLFAATACDEKSAKASYTPETFDETRIFGIDADGVDVAGQQAVKLVLQILLDPEESYFEFGTDGKVHGKISTVTLNIDELISSFGESVSKESIETQVRNVDIASYIKENAEPMFPGFLAHLAEGDVSGAMALVQASIGMNIGGIDFADEDVKAAFVKMGEEYKRTDGKNMHLPANLLDLIPAGGRLSLTMDWQYNIVRQTGNDGKTHDAVFIGGQAAHTTQTQPFGIFSLVKDADGNESLSLRIEFMNAVFTLRPREKK